LSEEAGRKYREAAYRAWRTIRRDRREKAAAGTAKLETFARPEVVGAIRHPELYPLSTDRHIRPDVVPLRTIRVFDKTPNDIVCGQFWELRWAFGCPFNCAYCYLRGTRRGNMKPDIIRPEVIIRELDRVFHNPDFNGGHPAIFNSGELSDSLMSPKVMAQVADFFETQKKHRLLLLSKSGAKAFRDFATRERSQTICAWSINPPQVAERWENRAAAPEDRLSAARYARQRDYEVRFRIDPIIPIENWKKAYAPLVESALSVGPTRVILGTPRGLHKTIIYAAKAGVDMEWASFFDRTDTGWGYKLSVELRKEVYGYMIDLLKASGLHGSQIRICKETTELHTAMGLSGRHGVCQCYSN
jgi:spore photoproduct lyase